MKNFEKILATLFALLIVLLIFVYSMKLLDGKGVFEPKPDSLAGKVVGLANPASVYCIEQGGTVEIRNEFNGQVGYCVFEDGSECEEWAYFRLECFE